MALVSKDDVGPEAVLALYKKLADSEQYQQYMQYRSEFDEKMRNSAKEISSFLEPDTKELIAGHDAVRKLYTRTAKLFLAVLVSVFGLIAILVQYFIVRVPELVPVVDPAFGLITTALFATCFGLYIACHMSSNEYLSVAHELREFSIDYEKRRLSLVQESFSSILNQVLGSQNRLDFPMAAPRLVELSTAAIVPSTSAIYLRDFISGHESSAVGIAGPRGCGKSTLMRALKADAARHPHAIYLTAPVKYDATEFVRRLYLAVAYAVMDDGYGHKARRILRRKDVPALRPRLLLSLASLGVGTSLIAVEAMPGEFNPTANFGPMGLAGGTFLMYGICALIFLLSAASLKESRERSESAGKRELTRVASAAIDRLSFDKESSSKSKHVGKFFGGSLSIEGEDAVTLKDRPLSLSDLITGLQSLLSLIAYAQSPSPVVVIVDELDKISQTDELVEMVNALKDLFHIQGVHFVVSVSTDALHSFEQRGLSARDAFDSSFDTIVRVNPLSLDESVRVIAARAEGFPTLVSAFCHAWSGGLPRDLLRVARRCVEVQRSQNGAFSIETLARTVMAEDIAAAAEAGLRTQEIPDELRAVYVAARRSCLRLAQGKGDPQDNSDHDPSSESIHSVVMLAEALATFFSNPIFKSPDMWSSFVAGREACEAAAKAMAARSEPSEIRAEYFSSALASLGAAKRGDSESKPAGCPARTASGS
jgi:energy-coupling factor transporter ATP-binding protein EcfA2